MLRPRNLAAAALLFATCLAGCRFGAMLPLERVVAPALRSAPTTGQVASTLSGGGAFFPLQVGNRWHYTQTFKLRWLDGTLPPFEAQSTQEQVLVSNVVLESRPYVAQRNTYVSDTQTFTDWTYYRQDRGGLYTLDADVGAPPDSAPAPPTKGMPFIPSQLASARVETGHPSLDAGTRAALELSEARLAMIHEYLGLPSPWRSWHRRPHPAPDEILSLAYPLVPGRHWVVRNDPRFVAHVVGIEVLHLPAGRFLAYRIRMEIAGLGPEDRVFLWYGRQGFLQATIHSISEGRDDAGNSTGLIVGDEREVLDAISLVGPHAD